MILRLKKYLALFGLILGLTVIFNTLNPKLGLTVETWLAQTIPSPLFSPPIQCTIGEDCFILLYPDRDPSPDAVDFGCGRQTYDGHSGTDFAISDEGMMAYGVPVLASAPGRVLRVRDGVEDRRVEDQFDRDAVEGAECGNGVVIDHSIISNGVGWETQYCHLRQGSIEVEPGDIVDTGSVLGQVGTSGLASFPHVHLSIRYQGEVVDPFVGPNASSGCNVTQNSLWDRPLPYTPTGLIRAGFSSEPPTLDQLWEGEFTETYFSADEPALLFWVQAYGTLAGDRVEYQLSDPRGRVVVEHQEQINSPSRTWLGYIGKRNSRQRPLTPGIWRGEYRLIRNGQIVIDVTRDAEIR
ncbi:MAG: peptidoglycan DD-metalloendopeptidase family protein [Lyngbya sp.]|nr:peptidoglycan DD-metalloendopeptidase family protein [Lyngbya sp.]